MTSINLELVDDDYEKRMDLAKMDCDKGDGDAAACHSVATFISAVKQDRKTAAQIFDKNCNQNNYAPSCFHLGRVFLTGAGVEMNDRMASEAFEKSCQSGHNQACNHLGIMLFGGSPGPNGIEANVERAVKLMDKSCKKGAVESCYHLGSQFLKKSGGKLKRDVVRARNLFEEGCAQGNGPSCFNLAVMYKNGDEGVESDPKKFEKYSKLTQEMVELQGGMK
mmetsp:Transcript_14538/g.20654  ORF Transcript_14538/g.20654 Transcript_14538/m.20654 type:complete len:222 (-) Transcript_14538:85-750(-)|eukprot:CAMPEP_0171456524 /NCGR_PEP_ID=MMETSP0945-20130129/2971_1 /TAXON_ID=109269 /ORGANISM="Vaucheria litorea, Strain CCMP2940" /LENGTH=221 /DNA_ID=CAMNT_0011981955 /DNA_START=41 /DNA_END=706 /DNA_ORIENTATION=+